MSSLSGTSGELSAVGADIGAGDGVSEAIRQMTSRWLSQTQRELADCDWIWEGREALRNGPSVLCYAARRGILGSFSSSSCSNSAGTMRI